MLPEVRVLLERAERRRHSIEGLLEAVPEPFWLRMAPGDGWSARVHVAHLAAVDAPVAALAGRAAAGASSAWLFETDDPVALECARTERMSNFVAATPPELAHALSARRLLVVDSLQALRPAALEMCVMVAGAVDSWGRQLSWSLRGYLGHWAEHDALHEAAVRAAFTTPPDLSAVAITRRLR